MKTKKETFASIISSFTNQYEERTVFDDFLTLTVCTYSQNPKTGKSFDEDLYLETIWKYKNKKQSDLFPKMLTCVVNEMEERLWSSEGHDVLGEYYEEHLYRKGASQYFTPWPVCEFMARMTSTDNVDENGEEMVLRILDPSCGSGRMLLAHAKENGILHEYFGIDIDLTCVKMAAINLFLSGIFSSEVLCADALDPDDFRVSYLVSKYPFGIFRIKQKEHSFLWNLNRASFKPSIERIVAPPPLSKEADPNFKDGTQLKLL